MGTVPLLPQLVVTSRIPPAAFAENYQLASGVYRDKNRNELKLSNSWQCGPCTRAEENLQTLASVADIGVVAHVAWHHPLLRLNHLLTTFHGPPNSSCFR